MAGIMGDNDIQGQFEQLVGVFRSQEWREMWEQLNLAVETFATLDIPRDISDRALWELCQARQIILVTGNRNKQDDDSLEATIQEQNQPHRLPVFTLADPERFSRSKAYVQSTAE